MHEPYGVAHGVPVLAMTGPPSALGIVGFSPSRFTFARRPPPYACKVESRRPFPIASLRALRKRQVFSRNPAPFSAPRRRARNFFAFPGAGMVNSPPRCRPSTSRPRGNAHVSTVRRYIPRLRGPLFSMIPLHLSPFRSFWRLLRTSSALHRQSSPIIANHRRSSPIIAEEEPTR